MYISYVLTFVCNLIYNEMDDTIILHSIRHQNKYVKISSHPCKRIERKTAGLTSTLSNSVSNIEDKTLIIQYIAVALVFDTNRKTTCIQQGIFNVCIQLQNIRPFKDFYLQSHSCVIWLYIFNFIETIKFLGIFK